jgi:hypothetical protein
MGPAFAVLGRRLEFSLENVLFRGGLDQSHYAVLVAEIEIAVGLNHSRRLFPGSPAPFPGEFAGLQFQANREARVMPVAAIDVVANEHHPAMMVLQLPAVEKIDFLGGHSVARLGELQQGGSRAVARGSKDIVVFDEGSRDIRRRVGDSVVVPQELPVLCPHRDHAAADDLHVLLHSAAIADHDGRVAGAVRAVSAETRGCLCFPDGFAGLFVERDDQRVFHAGRAQQSITVDERRFAETPTGHHFPAKIARQAFVPNEPTAGDIEADQRSLAVNGVDAVPVDRRRAVGVFAAGPQRPQPPAIGEIEGQHVASVLELAHGKDAARVDGHTRIAAAEPLCLPFQRRPFVRP